MAFQNFRPAKGYNGSEFVGLKQFKFLFNEPDFWLSFRNTLGMSILSLVFGFISAIVFALLLNEIRMLGFKKLTQTISYLPHFLSWVIVCSLITNILSSSDGMLNNLLLGLGIIDKPILWLGVKKYFWWIVAFSNVWKEMGWNSIIYIAAMSGIDSALYEAAEIDGANRYRRMWHVTLPGIRSTIIVIMIMNLGWILNSGFEVQYLLGRGLVQDVAQTLDIFVLKYGISNGNYSLATAAGIFKSVISIALVMSANYLASKFGEDNLI
ncbi:sugar ABC transporter permease [Anaerocolumna chitinilytica]|uniref:Sugar ABC transporter permease n=2 Tax=Anaerocolumna chitinilytica TaxID=1727145 RepID=A0A7I8DHJ7_9FIRM|nr:sugar ABC transporter permease [Anaerocolumna chitinilytica]